MGKVCFWAETAGLLSVISVTARECGRKLS